jgi:threonine dehydrogenase-like Zn-dependent dehydrogenase
LAEYAAVKAENVHPIGRLSFEEGALIEPLSCVLHGMDLLRMLPGDEVLIFGAGPMGLLLCQAAKLSGAARVSLTDLSEEKLELAKSLGVDDAFVAKDQVQRRIRRGHPDGFDVVIDATGVPRVVQELPKYVRDGGKLLYFGVCPKEATISLSPYDVYRRELHIFGTFSLLADFVPAIRLVENGRIDVKPIISHRFSLKESREAMNLMITPKHRKIIISKV